MKHALTTAVLLLVAFVVLTLPAGDIGRSQTVPTFAPGPGDYPTIEHDRLAARAGIAQRDVLGTERQAMSPATSAIASCCRQSEIDTGQGVQHTDAHKLRAQLAQTGEHGIRVLA